MTASRGYAGRHDAGLLRCRHGLRYRQGLRVRVGGGKGCRRGHGVERLDPCGEAGVERLERLDLSLEGADVVLKEVRSLPLLLTHTHTSHAHPLLLT